MECFNIEKGREGMISREEETEGRKEVERELKEGSRKKMEGMIRRKQE